MKRLRSKSLIVLLVVVNCTILVTGLFAFTQGHAAPGDCTLVVPDNPLTATGLATPYRLLAPCSEADANTQAFVQGAVFDPGTKQISIYNPLVITDGTTPAIAPTAPTLPTGAIVALWFGFNGNVLTLDNATGCEQGMVQFAYCNAPAFFSAVNKSDIAIPKLGTALDGLTCPTVRDFSIVDQDQSDNTTTQYILTATGQTAQATTANKAALGNTTVKNPSDERLLTLVDRAIGCTPFMAADLADGGNMVTALPLNELQAARYQKAPIGRVPAGDPFVGPNNLTLVNRYRRGVDQRLVENLNQASTKTYCRNLLKIAPERLNLDKQFTVVAASPMPDVASSLFTFVAQRFAFTFSANGLNCVGLLDVANPVTLTTDNNGVVTDAVITAKPEKANGKDTDVTRNKHE